jgi:hypothetical protein
MQIAAQILEDALTGIPEPQPLLLHEATVLSLLGKKNTLRKYLASVPFGACAIALEGISSANANCFRGLTHFSQLALSR